MQDFRALKEREARYYDRRPGRRRSSGEERSSMVEWSYAVIDHYGLDRQIVAVAFDYVDRCRLDKNGRDYQLITLAALGLAAKLASPVATHLTPHLLTRLTRGVFTSQQLVDTEARLLADLEWWVHPPTAADFCHCLVADSVLASAGFLMEQAVGDDFFVDYRASEMALAAIGVVHAGTGQGTWRVLRELEDVDWKRVGDCRMRLAVLCRTQQASVDAVREHLQSPTSALNVEQWNEEEDDDNTTK